jgi:tetratricopeptide (TPR) repeat protein
MIVERPGGREGINRILDLRVDDHPEPIEELRRLLGLWGRWHVFDHAFELSEAGDYEGALAEADRALVGVDEDAALLYNRACFASLAGRRDEALAGLARALELDPGMVESARSDPDSGDEEFLRLTGPAESRA